MKNFNELIQVEEPILIPSQKSMWFKGFFTEKNKKVHFYIPDGENEEILNEIIDIISKNGLYKLEACEMYLPVNKKPLLRDEIRSLIKDDVVDLSTKQGIIDAQRRFAVLAYMLLPEGRKRYLLHPVAGHTSIGMFKLPGGKVVDVSISPDRESREETQWWLQVVDCDRADLRDWKINPNYWFSFWEGLKELRNSSARS